MGVQQVGKQGREGAKPPCKIFCPPRKICWTV